MIGAIFAFIVGLGMLTGDETRWPGVALIGIALAYVAHAKSREP